MLNFSRLFILFIALFQFAIAQQVEFSQFYAAPLHLNNALAGISYGPRVAINYRNQWPELGDGPNGGFVTYNVSYDQHIEKLHGGVGVQFTSDRVSNNKIVLNTVSAMYSFQIRASKKFGIKLGLGGSYNHRYINWYDMLFYDQINPLSGFYQSIGVPNATTEIPPGNFNKHFFNANTGIVFFSNKYYGGIAAHNLVPEKDYFGNSTNRTRLAINAGAFYKLGKGYQKKYWISPQVLYTYQNNFNQITVGSLVGYDFIYLSLWMRHTINNFDAVIGGIGFKKSVLRFGYTFDINVSPLKGTAGSHELSFVFNFTKEESSLNPKSVQSFLACPFYLDF
ncbi:MAG: PorP/SprF family type IX secretion system membrane protein [Chitinophagales bacterium]|nr:PorP/SprF family type IX secretion system membrane protein [Bacteroidota bacterium]MCB9227451.1 PorP/SprF family type IX secretion system membrane protein [Chitinophagales bacterium]